MPGPFAGTSAESFTEDVDEVEASSSDELREKV